MEHFAAVRKKFNDAGVTIHSYTMNYSDDFTDAEIDKTFEQAKGLGTDIIASSTRVSMAPRLITFAEKHRTLLAFHGHSNTRDANEFATPESFDKALELWKFARINLDIGHFFAAGYDPVAYIDSHHDHITHLHLKDRKKNDGPNMPWGEGDTPIKPVLLLLKRNDIRCRRSSNTSTKAKALPYKKFGSAWITFVRRWRNSAADCGLWSSALAQGDPRAALVVRDAELPAGARPAEEPDGVAGLQDEVEARDAGLPGDALRLRRRSRGLLRARCGLRSGSRLLEGLQDGAEARDAEPPAGAPRVVELVAAAGLQAEPQEGVGPIRTRDRLRRRPLLEFRSGSLLRTGRSCSSGRAAGCGTGRAAGSGRACGGAGAGIFGWVCTDRCTTSAGRCAG